MLTAAEQLQRLLLAYPASIGHSCAADLWWQGDVSPTPMSRLYRVRVRYSPDWRIPICHVLAPAPHALVASSSLPGRALPHVYPNLNDALCLFFGREEWSPDDEIASTTVPWAALWLRFFETWLVTNTWEGSGAAYIDRPVLPESFDPIRPDPLTHLFVPPTSLVRTAVTGPVLAR